MGSEIWCILLLQFLFLISSQERFISGGRIVNKDACFTEQGRLHIIDRVLMPSNQTIAAILRESTNFTNFTSALDSVGLLEFLDNSDTSRTVFVVPDEAFMREIPRDLLNCLSIYMRRPLNDLLLFHVLKGAEYSSSIAFQRWLYTLRLEYLQVHASQDGSLALGFDIVPVIATDIPARNGVLHVVESILFPPVFNYGMCQRFVPTEPPPTGSGMSMLIP